MTVNPEAPVTDDDRTTAGPMPREIAMMITHHEELQTRLDSLTWALIAAARRGDGTGAECAALHEYVAGEVIPHARAEEDVIYLAGSTVPVLAPLVAGMLMEHHTLVGLSGRIARAGTDVDGAAAATAFAALFDVHVRKENDLLLPGLLAAGTDPADLLSRMQRAFTARRAEAAAAPAPGADEPGLLARRGEQVVDTRVHGAPSCADLANTAVDGLRAGGSFVLVADHDPRGIHYMLDAERPGATTWDVLEDGPQRWQARVGDARTGEPA